MEVVDSCFQELQSDCDRIYLSLKADYRKNRRDGLHSKVASVEMKLSFP
jgi:uncharacterized protein YqgV (UPF0045/DUF77 family)